MDKLIVVNAAYGGDRAGAALAGSTNQQIDVFSTALGNGSLGFGSSKGRVLLRSEFTSGSKDISPLFEAGIPDTKLYLFAGQTLAGHPNFGHEINPGRFSYTSRAASAGTLQAATYTVVNGVTLTADKRRYSLGLIFTFNDLRATGDKEIIDHRLEYRNSFYWDSASSPATELTNELAAFAKKITRQSKGLVTASVSGLAITIASTEKNVKFSFTRDKITNSGLTLTTSSVTAFGYEIGGAESVSDLERRCSSTYGANLLNTARGNSLYTKVSDVIDGKLYDTVIIKSNNFSSSPLFVNDNQGLVGTTYICIESSLNSAVTAHLIEYLELLKGYVQSNPDWSAVGS